MAFEAQVMYHCTITGDSASEVKSKTNEEYYRWLETASILNKKLNNKT
jgi:hypothetical protein